VTGVPMTVVCRALKVARSTAYRRSRARQGRFYRRAEDTEVLYQILRVTRQRASYGYPAHLDVGQPGQGGCRREAL
jgi:hypothetical protein